MPFASLDSQERMTPAGQYSQAPGLASLQEGHRLGVSGKASSGAWGERVGTESEGKSTVTPSTPVNVKALLAGRESEIAYMETLLKKPEDVSPVIAKLRADLTYAEDLWDQGKREASWHQFKRALRKDYDAEEDTRRFNVYAKNVTSVVELKHEAVRTGARINFGLTNAADGLTGGCC